jgi:hypothetical protein
MPAQGDGRAVAGLIPEQGTQPLRGECRTLGAVQGQQHGAFHGPEPHRAALGPQCERSQDVKFEHGNSRRHHEIYTG